MLFIGLDVGTTGAKALLVDERGKVAGKGYCGYKLFTDGPKAEQYADDWTKCGAEAITQALQGHDAKEIVAISLSTQGASTVALAKDGTPAGNALTWMDSRAAKEAAELERLLGGEYIYRQTGWRVNPSLDAAKIMHMKRRGDADKYLSTLEYVNRFLTGNAVCDPSNSSIRQIYDVAAQDYDDRILGAAGISRCELPEVVPTGALIGAVTAEASRATGLMEGTRVYNGAHDQYCASIGAGAIAKGDMLLSAGTTWVVMGISDRPLFSNTFIAPGVHPVPGLYGAMASLVGSGTSLQWFKDEFVPEGFGSIDVEAACRESKTEELFFYPYLHGASYPLWLRNARGAFMGILPEHDRFDFARAVMEGAAFGVRRALDDFRENGAAITRLRIMGGAAKSSLWCDLIAAASNVDISVLEETDACALGAAMIAATGSGVYESYEKAVANMVGKARDASPKTALVAAMARKYTRYCRMWDCVAGYYHRRDS